VRSVADYLEKAAEFETLAAAANVDALKKRYGDIAACYRLLAEDREWLSGTGTIASKWSAGPKACGELNRPGTIGLVRNLRTGP
jgi:hypothetical protein